MASVIVLQSGELESQSVHNVQITQLDAQTGRRSVPTNTLMAKRTLDTFVGAARKYTLIDMQLAQ